VGVSGAILSLPVGRGPRRHERANLSFERANGCVATGRPPGTSMASQ
jgi:hypothetical protein